MKSHVNRCAFGPSCWWWRFGNFPENLEVFLEQVEIEDLFLLKLQTVQSCYGGPNSVKSSLLYYMCSVKLFIFRRILFIFRHFLFIFSVNLLISSQILFLFSLIFFAFSFILNIYRLILFVFSHILNIYRLILFVSSHILNIYRLILFPFSYILNICRFILFVFSHILYIFSLTLFYSVFRFFIQFHILCGRTSCRKYCHAADLERI